MPDILTFKYCPLQSGYTAESDSGVIEQKLDGGAPRFRRASKNNVGTASCSWVLDELGYQYCMAFYRKWSRNPAKHFRVKMLLDTPIVEPYDCWFVPNSLRLTGKDGPTYSVSAQLIVKSKKISESFDDEIINIVDNDRNKLFNPMDKLANVDLPGATGVKKNG